MRVQNSGERRCPIANISFPGPGDYSKEGLSLLDRNLTTLKRLPHSAIEQRLQAISRSGKMSIQGVQPKLSAVLRITEKQFELVDSGGRYILKPQSADYPELPENESLTMRLASTVLTDVPVHGMIYSADGSFTYFIKRFDRKGSKRISLEDFAQLSGASRETKYESSMESVVEVIDRYATFPQIERLELLRRTLFNFLTGNEDMHLKNFSLWKSGPKITLAPVYDFLNTTIAIPNPQEELALPLKGKKRRLTRNDFLKYFAKERLELSESSLNEVIRALTDAIAAWHQMIDESFLSSEMKARYSEVLRERADRLL